jgi:lantibiotic modifying enzyme
MMTNKHFVEILKGLPDTKLAIIELTWKLTKKDGEVDYDKSIEMIEEIEAAQKQVEHYVNGVSGVKLCLIKLLQS